jgi:hypothetical protein
MATSSGDSTLLEAQHSCRTQQTHGPPPTRSGFVEPYLAGTRGLRAVQIGLQSAWPGSGTRTDSAFFHRPATNGWVLTSDPTLRKQPLPSVENPTRIHI